MKKIADYFQNSPTGFCIKDKSKRVIYQNPSCIGRCGKKMGTICEDGCMKTYEENKSNLVSQGIKLPPSTHADEFQWVVVNDGEALITLQCPTKSKNDLIKNRVSEYGLTQSEFNIVKMRLEMKTNSQIASELFISKATLKTHLNNIYKKIPSELKALLTSK